MATTYDYVDTTSNNARLYGDGISALDVKKFFCHKRTVNLATAVTDLNSGNAFGAGDVLNLFNVAEGMLIQGIAVECTTAEGATLSVSIGDDTDPDGFLTAFDLVSTGWFWTGDGTYEGDYVDGTTYLGGKLYTSADQIDITLTTAGADTAVFDIYIWGIDMRPVAS